MFEECFVCIHIVAVNYAVNAEHDRQKTIRRLRFSKTGNVSILSPNPTKQFFVDTTKGRGETRLIRSSGILYIYVCSLGFEFLSRRYNFMLKNTFQPVCCCSAVG